MLYEVITYASIDQINEAIVNGEIDGGVTGGFQPTKDFRSIADFSPRDFFFVTTKGNDEILRGLNQAIKEIKIINPYFDKELARITSYNVCYTKLLRLDLFL